MALLTHVFACILEVLHTGQWAFATLTHEALVMPLLAFSTGIVILNRLAASWARLRIAVLVALVADTRVALVEVLATSERLLACIADKAVGVELLTLSLDCVTKNWIVTQATRRNAAHGAGLAHHCPGGFMEEIADNPFKAHGAAEAVQVVSLAFDPRELLLDRLHANCADWRIHVVATGALEGPL